MALIKCPECGKKVSTESTRCRNCGFPISEIKEELKINDTAIEEVSVEKGTSEPAKNIKTIRCKSCGIEIAEGARFCPECGCNLYSDNTTSNNEQDNVETSIVVNSTSTGTSKRKSKTKPWIIVVVGALAVLIIAILLFPKNGIENEVKAILEDDLGSSVKITTLYYNEDKQGCLVEFEAKNSIDVAAIHLDTGKIEYESEFDYYTAKMNNATSSSERGKYAQKVLEFTDLAGWKFAVVTSSTEELQEYGWKKIK